AHISLFRVCSRSHHGVLPGHVAGGASVGRRLRDVYPPCAEYRPGASLCGYWIRLQSCRSRLRSKNVPARVPTSAGAFVQSVCPQLDSNESGASTLHRLDACHRIHVVASRVGDGLLARASRDSRLKSNLLVVKRQHSFRFTFSVLLLCRRDLAAVETSKSEAALDLECAPGPDALPGNRYPNGGSYIRSGGCALSMVAEQAAQSVHVDRTDTLPNSSQ